MPNQNTLNKDNYVQDPRYEAFKAKEDAEKAAKLAIFLGPLSKDKEENAVTYERDMDQSYGGPLSTKEAYDRAASEHYLMNKEYNMMKQGGYGSGTHQMPNGSTMLNSDMKKEQKVPEEYSSSPLGSGRDKANDMVYSDRTEQAMSNYDLARARFKSGNPNLTETQAREMDPDPLGLRGIIPGNFDLASLMSPIAKWWENR